MTEVWVDGIRWCTSEIPVLGRWGQEDGKVKASLNYVASFGPAWTTQARTAFPVSLRGKNTQMRKNSLRDCSHGKWEGLSPCVTEVTEGKQNEQKRPVENMPAEKVSSL